MLICKAEMSEEGRLYKTLDLIFFNFANGRANLQICCNAGSCHP